MTGMSGFEQRWLTSPVELADPDRILLLEQANLAADDQADEALLLLHQGRPVATAARLGKVLRQIAVHHGHQGQNLTAQLVNAMRDRLFMLDIFNCQVYTRPQTAYVFEDLGFHRLAETDEAVLLESGHDGLEQFVDDLASHCGRNDGPHGCIVLNANPFTRGHRWLVEQAHARCGHLFLIVLEDQRTDFPPETRRELVRRGCADLANTTVLGGGDYVISAGTFPRYFLKQADTIARTQARLDLTLFIEHIVPALGITARFAGEEPRDPLTAIYNEAMGEMLPAAGIEFMVFERLRDDTDVISASRVRKAFFNGDLDSIAHCLPPTTLDFLNSPQGQAIRDTWIKEHAS
jgi:[citrate (pro-3S)-lyase] ligase